MSTLEIFLTVLSILSTFCAIAFGYAAFNRNRKKDTSDEGKNTGVMLTEIGYIKSNTDSIMRKQEKQDEQHLQVVERLSAVESSAKQAHHRIDRLENKGE